MKTHLFLEFAREKTAQTTESDCPKDIGGPRERVKQNIPCEQQEGKEMDYAKYCGFVPVMAEQNLCDANSRFLPRCVCPRRDLDTVRTARR